MGTSHWSVGSLALIRSSTKQVFGTSHPRLLQQLPTQKTELQHTSEWAPAGRRGLGSTKYLVSH